PVAIELSSFQLEALDEHGLSPRVAVLTSLSPDHPDRYPSFDDHARTKAAIFAHQAADNWAVVEDGLLHPAIEECVVARRVTFGERPRPEAEYALWVDGECFTGRWGGAPVDLGPVASLRLPGAHSRLNAL